MSLIQEALRRQQEDMDDSSGAPAPVAPTAPAPAPIDPPTIAKKAPINTAPSDMDTSAPPPVQQPPQLDGEEPPPPPAEALAQDDDTPPPPPPSAQGKDSKPGMKVALIIAAAVACLGVGIWAVTYFMAPSAPAEAPATDVPEVVEDVPEVVESDIAAPTEPVAPVAAQPVQPDPVNTVKRPPAPPPPPVKTPVEWPILTINGFVGKGASGAVIIDGNIVDVEHTVMGVKIVSIQKDGVTLSYMGETKFVRKDQTTE